MSENYAGRYEFTVRWGLGPNKFQPGDKITVTESSTGRPFWRVIPDRGEPRDILDKAMATMIAHGTVKRA